MKWSQHWHWVSVLLWHWSFNRGKINKTGLTIQDASKFTKQASTHFDWIKFFQSNLTLQVLVASIIIGIILNYSKHRLTVIHFLGRVSHYVFTALKYVMYLAPLGAFGGMAFTIGKFGLKTLIPLAKLMGCVYLTMFLFVFLVLGSIMKYYKLSVWKYLVEIKEELLVVLGTSSSEAALPSIMRKLEKMGCTKSVVGLVGTYRLFIQPRRHFYLFIHVRYFFSAVNTMCS